MNMASLECDSDEGETEGLHFMESMVNGPEETGELGDRVHHENEKGIEMTGVKLELPVTSINLTPLLKIKSSDDQSLYFCNECPYKSNFKRSVKRHIDSVHMKLRSYKCPFCEYKANYMSNTKRHVRSVHNREVRFACPRCDYRTSDKGHLSSHIKAVHDKLKPFHCQECKYHASKRTDLNVHVKAVHQREKPYMCLYCSYKAAKHCNLKRHVKNIHESPQPPKKKNCTSDADMSKTSSEQNEPTVPKIKINSSDPRTNYETSETEPIKKQNTTKSEYTFKSTKTVKIKSTLNRMSFSSEHSETILNNETEFKMNLMDMMANREIEISIVPKSQ